MKPKPFEPLLGAMKKLWVHRTLHTMGYDGNLQSFIQWIINFPLLIVVEMCRSCVLDVVDFYVINLKHEIILFTCLWSGHEPLWVFPQASQFISQVDPPLIKISRDGVGWLYYFCFSLLWLAECLIEVSQNFWVFCAAVDCVCHRWEFFSTLYR